MNILLINGNPKTKSYGKRLTDTYESAAKEAGAEIRRIDLNKLKFDPILWEGYDEIQELEPDLKKAQEDILWSEHIVIVFPTWWASLPAILKGFIDRTFLPGFAFNYVKGKLLPKQHLKGRTAHLIITMGGPSILYRLIGAPGMRLIKTGTLGFCGIKTKKVTLLGSIRPENTKNMEKGIAKIKKIASKQK